jgi:hypothetical protein
MNNFGNVAGYKISIEKNQWTFYIPTTNKQRKKSETLPHSQ